MKILFVVLDTSFRGLVFFGPAYLSAVLKKQGHSVELLDLHYEPLERGHVARRLASFNPGLICVSVLTIHRASESLRAAGLLKEISTAPIVFGGTAVTADPDYFIQGEGVDMVCIGEGEEAIVELAERLQNGIPVDTVKNFWIKTGGETVRNPVRPLLQNLDSLPLVDRDLFFSNPAFRREDIPYLAFMAGRGCPYDCTYCINPLIKKLYGARGLVRFRTPGNVVAEIEEAVRRYSPFSFAYFEDDTFTLDRNWLRGFADAMTRSGLRVPLSINARLDAIDREMIETLVAAGVKEVRFGVETGDAQVSRSILKRRNDYEKIRANAALLRGYGLFTKTYNLVGIPGETRHSVFRTILCNTDIAPDVDFYSIFQPYPGTELGELCRRKGYIDKDLRTISSYSEEATISTETLSRRDVNKLSSLAFAVSNVRRHTPLGPLMRLGGTRLRMVVLEILYLLFFRSDRAYRTTLAALSALGRMRKSYVSGESTYLSRLDKERPAPDAP